MAKKEQQEKQRIAGEGAITKQIKNRMAALDRKRVMLGRVEDVTSEQEEMIKGIELELNNLYSMLLERTLSSTDFESMDSILEEPDDLEFDVLD
mgnify:CR=1 FL=1